MSAIYTWPENGIEYGVWTALQELTPDVHRTSERCKICGIAEYKPMGSGKTARKGETTMKVFGDPRARAKARKYIIWGIEDGIVCASFLGGIALAGWLFHVIFTALGVV